MEFSRPKPRSTKGSVQRPTSARRERDSDDSPRSESRSEQFFGEDRELTNHNRTTRSSGGGGGDESGRSSKGRRPPSLRIEKPVKKEIARLPLSVTGGIEPEEEEVEEEEEVDSDEERRRREEEEEEEERDSARRSSKKKKKHKKDKHDRDRYTPRSRRGPDSPSLSSLMRNLDSEDPTKDPLGRHHHAKLHEITTSHQPKLIEYTKISRDGRALEHHVTSEKQYGTAHERTLAEMEHIMRVNEEFPIAGQIGPSGFPSDPKETRRLHAHATGDDLLDNPLGDPVEPSPNVLDGEIDRTLEKYHRDPFINEKELEYYRPHSVFPTEHQKIEAIKLGEPVLVPSERELVKTSLLDAAKLRTKQRLRSDSLTELDQYAADLAFLSAQDNAPLLPPRTPVLTPRDDGLRPPPTPPSAAGGRPITPPEYAIGVANTSRQIEQPQPGGGRRPTRDLFDVSPRGVEDGLQHHQRTKKKLLAPELNIQPSTSISDPLHDIDLGTRSNPLRHNGVSDVVSPSSRRVKSNTSGGVFGQVARGVGSFDVFDAHAATPFATATTDTSSLKHTSEVTLECGLCADRPSVYHCYDCGLSLCSGPHVRRSVVGDATTLGLSSPKELDSGCHEAIHQEFHNHHFKRVSEMKDYEQRKAKDSKMKQRVEKENQRDFMKGEYQPSLVLVEPIDPLELQPPPPPSPPRFARLIDEHLKLGSELDLQAEQDMAILKGSCALCQTSRATVWCEECQLALCSSLKPVLVDDGTQVIHQHDDSNPDCDGSLHSSSSSGEGLHAGHHRIRYDPTLHKRTLRMVSYPYASQDIGSLGDQPPSLPPSNLTTPRYLPTTKELNGLTKLKHVPGEWNYKTGSRNPTCDICEQEEAELYCQECEMYLCKRGGCDHDAHSFSNTIESSVHGSHLTSHHRIAITSENLGKILLTPLQTPRFTPENSPRKNQRQDRRSRTPSPTPPRSSRTPRSTRTTPRPRSSSSKRWLKNPWCQRCGRNESKLSCSNCEMVFCTGGCPGQKENCDKVWHECEPSFQRHIRCKIDPSTLDRSIPQPKAQGPSEEEKEQARLMELQRNAELEALAAERAAREAETQARETAELEKRVLTSRQLSKSFDEDDDVLQLLRAQRDQARAMDAGPTPRTVKKARLGDDGFDPDEIQPPPQCQECEENRSDVYCLQCKKFYCAHPLNYTNFDGPSSFSSASASGGGPPSPPRTPTHHNNCHYHVHALPINHHHKSINLAHYEAERERRRSAKYAQREREAALRKKESEALAREAEEARRALALQKDAKLRAAEERRLEKIRMKQERLRQKQAAYEQMLADQQLQASHAKERAKEEAEQDRLAWLERARTQIVALDAEKEAFERAQSAEFDALRAAHRKMVLARETALHDADSRRWLAHREEIRRKRAIRAENLNAQREWLARRERADKVWRENVAKTILEKHAHARKASMVEAANTNALQSRLGAHAAGIGRAVDAVIDETVASKESTNSKLVKVSAALLQRREDLAELARSRREEAAEAERRIIAEGISDELDRKRREREDRARQELRDGSEDHRERLADLKRSASIERKRAADATLIRSKVADAAERAAYNLAKTRAELDAERTKLMALREKKHARELARRKVVEKKVKNLGRVREDESDRSSNYSATSSTIRSATSTNRTALSEKMVRPRPQRPSDLQRHTRTATTTTTMSQKRPPSRRAPSESTTGTSRSVASSDVSVTSSALSSDSSDRRTVSTKSGSSARTNSTGITGTSRSGSEYTNTVDSGSEYSSRSSMPSELASSYSRSSGGWTHDGDSVVRPPASSSPSLYTDRSVSTIPVQSQEDFTPRSDHWQDDGPDGMDMSVDDFLDSFREEVEPPKHRHRRQEGEARRRTRSRSRSRSHSRSRSQSSDYSDGSSDATADDLSISSFERLRSAGLKKAPRAKDLVRDVERRQGANQKGMERKFTLEELQARDQRGELKDNTHREYEYDREAEIDDRHRPSRLPLDPLPRDPASDSTRRRRRKQVESDSGVAPGEVWAMRIGASERGESDSEDGRSRITDAPSDITYRSQYSDDTIPTQRSNAISALSGVDLHEDGGDGDHHARRHSSNGDASAGVVRNTSRDLRAARHASSNATTRFVGVLRDPHQLSSQLLSLLESSPGLNQPLRRVFTMLVQKWLNESNKKERDTEILQQAFRVLMTKLIRQRRDVDGQPGHHQPNQDPFLRQLAQIWQELMQTRLSATSGDGGDGASEASFTLGQRRGHVDGPFGGVDSGDGFDGSYSARRDGVTNLLIRSGADSTSSGTRRYERDDTQSVMGGTRSVTGSSVDDADDQRQPVTLMQQQARSHARAIETAQSQRIALQRRAERVIKEQPYSDYEESFDSITDSQVAEELAADHREGAFGGFTRDDQSDLSTDRRIEREEAEAASLASFSLGLDPRRQVLEDRRARRMAKDGDEPVSEVGSIRSDSTSAAERRGEPQSESSSDSDNASDSDSDLDSSRRRHRVPPNRGQISLPPFVDRRFNEDAWYMEFHRRALRKEEKAAFRAQEKYDADRRKTIAEVRERDQPEPNPYTNNEEQHGRYVSKSASEHEQRRYDARRSATGEGAMDEFEPGSSIHHPPTSAINQANQRERMIRMIDGEVGGLQCAAGLRAQSQPHTFLPHEIRQHQLRFGVEINPDVRSTHGHRTGSAATPTPQAASVSSYPSDARDWDRKLTSQMRANDKWNRSHTIKASSSSSSTSLPLQQLSSSPVHVSKLDPRVTAVLLKARDALGGGIESSQTTQHDFADMRQTSNARSHKLPAASHITPDLAYLQQLRRREIVDGTKPKGNKRT